MEMHKLRTFGIIALGAMFAAAFATKASAADKPWWPFPTEHWSSGEARSIEYTPLEKASKKWHICVLFPHLKDSWWVAAGYGIAEEAKRQGVQMTLLQAGGYTELNKQISQYDDCVAYGVDAIVMGVVSESGMSRKIEEGREKGIVQVTMANPVIDAPVHAKIFADHRITGYIAGQFVLEHFKDRDSVRAVQFPGPQGSGWAEASAEGFHRAIKGTNIQVLEDKYGDTGKSVQLKLVEDALQTYQDIDLIFGTAVTAEVAIGALEEQGLADKVEVVSWYANQGMIDSVINGEMLGAMNDSPVIQGRISIDLAIRILEEKEFHAFLYPVPQLISQETLETLDMTWQMAPKGYQPEYSVD